MCLHMANPARPVSTGFEAPVIRTSMCLHLDVQASPENAAKGSLMPREDIIRACDNPCGM